MYVILLTLEEGVDRDGYLVTSVWDLPPTHSQARYVWDPLQRLGMYGPCLTLTPDQVAGGRPHPPHTIPKRSGC